MEKELNMLSWQSSSNYSGDLQRKQRLMSLLDDWCKAVSDSDVRDRMNVRNDGRLGNFGISNNTNTVIDNIGERRRAQQEKVEQFLRSVGIDVTYEKQNASSPRELFRELTLKAAEAAEMLASYFSSICGESIESSYIPEAKNPAVRQPSFQIEPAYLESARPNYIPQRFYDNQGNAVKYEVSRHMNSNTPFNGGQVSEYHSRGPWLEHPGMKPSTSAEFVSTYPEKSQPGRIQDPSAIYPDRIVESFTVPKPENLLQNMTARQPVCSSTENGSQKDLPNQPSSEDLSGRTQYSMLIKKPLPFGIGQNVKVMCPLTRIDLENFCTTGVASLYFFDAVASLFAKLVFRDWIPRLNLLEGATAPPLPKKGAAGSFSLLIVRTSVVIIRWSRRNVVVLIPREHLVDEVRTWCEEQMKTLYKMEGEKGNCSVSVSPFPDNRVAPMEYHILEAMRSLTMNCKKNPDVMRWYNQNNRRELVNALGNFLGIP